MRATDVLTVAAEGGVIGDGRTGANLALGVGLLGVAIGWLALARVAGRISTGSARIGAMSAMAAGVVGIVLAALHLATSSGGPGTGNGMVGAVAALPLGLTAMAIGRRALTRSRSRSTELSDERAVHERGSGSVS
ncbi:hypothetical protein GCM10010372_04620 [Streptomyces tauricus]|uniref:DUF6223 family protein n=1 Tax=Streptomyces tauricus TaxID=68274 RepID=A0ABZ1J9R8_9ACTN|nr:DUF6223 family protein [Streptomyces tauricus]MCW8103552.1 DUF6223 family protein [Streptomyces tauricus]GHA08347.1 hypothetical protein GCM10010372_04620 [Streptomyces tauricus]